MNHYLCPGLDGTNPLHMLAALGLMRLSDRIMPKATLHWQRPGGHWSPVIGTSLAYDEWLQALVAWILVLGAVGAPDPSLNRKVRDLNAQKKKCVEKVKEAQKQAKAEVKARNLRGMEAKAFVEAHLTGPQQLQAKALADLQDAQASLANANGQGIAHLGEIIGVDPKLVATSVESSLQAWFQSGPGPTQPVTDDPHLVVAQLAALACESIQVDGKVTPTPFSFSNGASAQNLLKDFRSCACKVTPSHLVGTLSGTPERNHPGQKSGLNWDPVDQRDYALAWADPATNAKSIDVAANALAYLGLSLLPVVPQGARLKAVGWGPGEAFTWPLWTMPLPLPVLCSLLADCGLQAEHPRPEIHGQRGIIEIRRSIKINPTGKRCFFAPSAPV